MIDKDAIIEGIIEQYEKIDGKNHNCAEELALEINDYLYIYYGARYLEHNYNDRKMLNMFKYRTVPLFKTLDAFGMMLVMDKISFFAEYASEEVKMLSAYKNVDVFMQLENPPIDLQKNVLEQLWYSDYIHEKFNNDEFLKSKWIRMMKLKKGTLEERTIPF